MAVKNRRSPFVRNGTSDRKRPETRDRRVQRTKRALHEALIDLAREKPYDAIPVKDILQRADVGRSTFYMHFRDKHDLLESGMHDVLRSAHERTRHRSAVERVLAFSRPVLEHIDAHRRAGGPPMPREGRLAMHRHLCEALTSMIAGELGTESPRSHSDVPSALLARHLATTFVLVLEWWIDNETRLTPADVDARFRALVEPAVSAGWSG